MSIMIDHLSRVETGDEIPEDPHAHNEFLHDGGGAPVASFCRGGPQSAPQLASPIKPISLERSQLQLYSTRNFQSL